MGTEIKTCGIPKDKPGQELTVGLCLFNSSSRDTACLHDYQCLRGKHDTGSSVRFLHRKNKYTGKTI